jgi:hypothetical protein
MVDVFLCPSSLQVRIMNYVIASLTGFPVSFTLQSDIFLFISYNPPSFQIPGPDSFNEAAFLFVVFVLQEHRQHSIVNR